MKTIKTTVRVNFIGKIWMPAATCASKFTLSDSDNARFTEPWDLSDDEQCLEFVEHFLHGEKSGDFQSVTDFEAIREVKTVEVIENTTSSSTVKTHSEFTTLHAWADEESEFAYVDCMYQD